MKIKKSVLTLALLAVIAASFTAGAAASGTLKEIAAYLNYGITIKYDGETQNLTDAAGNRVYPITFNGTTYLPVRAVSNMLGIAVDWDQATQTVLLGEKADGTDLIDNFKPYNSYTTSIDYRGSLDPEFIQSSEKQTTTIGGVSVSHWLAVRSDYLCDDSPECSFNLGGKYDTLTFQTYADKDMTLIVTGDNGSVLGQLTLKGGQVPQSLTIDLHGTTQLTFDCEQVPGSTSYTGDGKVWCTYIFDAILK